MAYHGPDFSSSEDEFDDPDFKELVRQQRLERNQNYNGNLTEKQLKEQKIRKIHNDILHGNNDEVLKVVNEVIGLNEKLEDDWTLISLAASVGNYDLLVQLYEMGAEIKTLRGGDTILMCACNCPVSKAAFEESSRVIQFLLDKGVDVNAKNRKRMNALMFAASNGNLNAVELLLPLVDLNEEDNQSWDALFWAVYGGNASLVEFLIDKGMSIDRTDIRGNTPLDIAVDNNYQDIIKLLTPEEEDGEDYAIDTHINFEDIFRGLKDKEKPLFLQDIYNFLYGTRCENLMKLFVNNNVSLLDLLSSSEEEFKDMGVAMPFQRRRLMTGIHIFHKTPFQPGSIPVVGKNELYSNVDIAVAVFSAIKQSICMEAALKYIMKNGDNLKCAHGSEEIENVLCSLESKVSRLKKVVVKLQSKGIEWDSQIEQVNIITSRTGKRWFPWRKTVILFGIVIAVSVKLWKKTNY
ncbi:ankyrin repeat, SAM and basic leucine zipper domain-containing protein 1-like [Coccinella septempunctata]|uniref:ankyrin repeat, SAM and basic leucine zipper domain-containing protein 1-like n=1 Tax=Coccinella septempunctata TaxID=41139 RepID=UPI001D069D59|nr:ankyrin repeat, SAM and basic leucine zipper domain-containing protein 1-like [Coccinella septempunctata]